MIIDVPGKPLMTIDYRYGADCVVAADNLEERATRKKAQLHAYSIDNVS
jgi:hypothetical protein